METMSAGKVSSKPLIIVAGAAVALAGIGGYVYQEWHRPAVLEIYVFDTPGSPCAFIRTPNDRRVLIDGGSNSDIVRFLTGNIPFYSRRIDTVIVTSADGAHVTGLVDVLNRYDVGQIILPGVTLQSLGLSSSSDPIYQVLLDTIEKHQIQVKEVSTGSRLILDDDSLNPVTANIIFPAIPIEFQYSHASSPEILMRIDYGATSMTFMGNATTKIQKFLAKNDQLPTDGLITSLPANGSNFSRELIDSLAPDYLIYSQSNTKHSNISESNDKKLSDPLAGILSDHRFNVKGEGTIRMISDGIKIAVEQNK